MKFERGEEIERFNQFYPSTVTLVGSCRKGKANLMPSSWHTALSRDPLLYGVSVSPKRQTYSMIKGSGEFTLNFVDARHFRVVTGAGQLSGRDVDKFEALKIPFEPGRLVASPILTGAYCAYECKVEAWYPAGDHDIVVGKIVGVHTDEKAYRENGVLRLKDAGIDLYMGASTYARLQGDVWLGPEET